MDFEAARGTENGTGHLFRILLSFGLLLVTSIVVIIVFVARHETKDIPQMKPDIYTPPTLLA